MRSGVAYSAQIRVTRGSAPLGIVPDVASAIAALRQSRQVSPRSQTKISVQTLSCQQPDDRGQLDATCSCSCLCLWAESADWLWAPSTTGSALRQQMARSFQDVVPAPGGYAGLFLRPQRFHTFVLLSVRYPLINPGNWSASVRPAAVASPGFIGRRRLRYVSPWLCSSPRRHSNERMMRLTFFSHSLVLAERSAEMSF